MGSYKYKLQKENCTGSMYTNRNLNWFEKLKYRLKGYKVIKLN